MDMCVKMNIGILYFVFLFIITGEVCPANFVEGKVASMKADPEGSKAYFKAYA